MEINVSMGGNLFSRETIDGFIIGSHCSEKKLEFLVSVLVKDVYGIALVYEHLFVSKVLKLNGDDHGVILLLVDTVEMGVGEGDGGHSASEVGVGNVVDGLDITKMFLSS